MIKIQVKNLLGEKVGEMELSQDVFGVKKNEELLHQVMVARYANQRLPIAHSKTRAERSGSGAKPWKQKGTGRARTGAVRNPVWKKGGIVFGPRNDRNFKQKVNKKANRLAIKMVLSEKVKAEQLVILDELKLAENKTKVMAQALNKLGIDKRVLLVLAEEAKLIKMFSRNIDLVENVFANQLNLLNLLNNKYVLIDKAGINFLEEKYGKRK